MSRIAILEKAKKDLDIRGSLQPNDISMDCSVLCTMGI